MIQRQLKLKLTPRQERQLNHWLRHLGSVWNWGVRKIEQDAQGGIYYSSFSLQKLLNGHGAKIGVPQDVIDGTLKTAHEAWQRCFKKIGRKPHLKGYRNRLNSIAFAHGTKIYGDRVSVVKLGRVRFHAQDVPEGHIGQMWIVKRASGWCLCVFIQAQPNAIPRIANGQIGIDPGFSDLLTLSTGEKIAHPREREALALRLAQAQRGNDRRLTARIQERITNQRKDRNHKLTRRLVSENVVIRFSKDNIKGIAKRFGKSVLSSGHYQMRQMFAYKSRIGGSEYDEPDSRRSTITCSTCGALTGPRGLAGLKVRRWTCGCDAEHDRDINAAVNTLNAGAGAAHERQAIAA
jgi:transposase